MPCVSRPALNHRARGPGALTSWGWQRDPPPLTQISDLLLLPGDSTAEGAESALHLGAPVAAPLYLAGTVLAPGVERSMRKGRQASRATVSQSCVTFL